MTLAPDTPVYEAYRSVVAARPEAVEDVRQDRVRIARLDDPDFGSLRALLARCARVERALVPSAAGLAATRTDAAAMALSAVAANHAAGVDGLVRYWDRVVDGEEHARGNDLTGLTSDRWLEDTHPLDLPGAADPDDAARVALARYLVGEALLARGLSGVLAATVDGSVAGLPTLPALAETVEHRRTRVSEHVAAVSAVAGDLDGGDPAPIDEPAVRLRDALPSVPEGVSVETVVDDSVETYRSAMERLKSGAATDDG